ncbi:MAG: hypothetical protein OEQ74_07255, partial [Gammaproteobacteria bacterium]|nr:hypothetical protein [Gammaproteobacteria bacterium]
TPLTGQLPSFLHTLAFALACALVPARLPAALAAILAWGLVELLAELAQHDRVSLAAPLEPYQLASTFDPMDLVAITLAILVALGLTLALRSTPEASPQ